MILLLMACATEEGGGPIPPGQRPPLGGDDTAVQHDSGDSEAPLDSDDTGEEPVDDTGEPQADECPDGVTCVEHLPFAVRDTTVGGAEDFDSYACSPGTDESGPELVYRVTLTESGFLAADLRDMASGADIDVHILGSLDEDDCYDRGHWAAGALLPAGDYFIVADSWVNSSGAAQSGEFKLNIGHTSAADLAAHGMDESLAELALYALDSAWLEGQSEHAVYGVLDFSQHSSFERLWITDLATEELLWHLHVTHGENTAGQADPGKAKYFSNVNESHKSSLGMMVTAEDYTGSNGYSMRMDGLEDGYNDNVRARAIVVHGATYARAEIADTYGYLGLSWGCPAVDDRVSDEVIGDLQGGLLWSYYPDGDWSEHSVYLP